jgi:surface protein
MSDMFLECENFNQPLDKWDVSNVVNMENMFQGCKMFNQPLNGWNVSNVVVSNNAFADCAISEENKPIFPTPRKKIPTPEPTPAYDLLARLLDADNALESKLHYQEIENYTGEQCRSNKIKPTPCKFKKHLQKQRLLFHPDKNLDCTETAKEKFQNLENFKTCLETNSHLLPDNPVSGGSGTKRKKKRSMKRSRKRKSRKMRSFFSR